MGIQTVQRTKQKPPVSFDILALFPVYLKVIKLKHFNLKKLLLNLLPYFPKRFLKVRI